MSKTYHRRSNIFLLHNFADVSIAGHHINLFVCSLNIVTYQSVNTMTEYDNIETINIKAGSYSKFYK